MRYGEVHRRLTRLSDCGPRTCDPRTRGRSLSVPSALVHNVQERLACRETPAVVREQVDRRIPMIGRKPDTCGVISRFGTSHIGLCGRKRLVAEDVERGAATERP